MKAEIRKITVFVEEVRREMDRPVTPPTRKACAVAVIRNPFAGRYVQDLADLMEIGAELGGLLGQRCVQALGIRPEQAESYGKAAMVGENGELEHAAAILHPRSANPCGRRSRRVRPSSLPARNVVDRARFWTFHWVTRTPLTCARISTAWKYG